MNSVLANLLLFSQHFLGLNPVLVSDLDLAIRTKCACIITVFVFLLWKTLFEDNREARDRESELSAVTYSLY